MREVPRTLAGPAAGLLGAIALLVVGIVLRPVLRVPTLPEVLAEWATFHVPPELFAYMINTFREGAKAMLFWSLVGLVLLAGVGLGALFARWPTPRVAIGLAFGLWLLTLLVIFPSSGLGFFGMDAYPAGPAEDSAAYLAGWGAFAGVLSLVYWLLVPSSRGGRRAAPSAGVLSNE
jgi:hypothetical protein